MAKMYPGNGPAITKSNAEKMLYPIFRDSLDDSYQVYHSRWWSFKYRTGETDFLVVHPIKGILVIEVKGGKIEYDNFSDSWYSNGQKLNKSPYVQAEDTCKELVRFLKHRFNFFKSRNFTYKFCVLFPDIDEIINPTIHGEDKTITGKDLINLQSNIEIILGSIPQGTDKLEKQGLNELYKIIAPETEFKIYDINAISRNEELINRFSDEQLIILEELMDFPQVVVLGCAGSGKTQLALAKTRELVRQRNKVLITCKSDNLAGYLYFTLKEFIDSPDFNIQVSRFHRLPAFLEKQLDINNLKYSNTYEHLSLLSEHEVLKFDSIIIDEGQDFTSKEINLVKKFLKDEQESIFYIFQDDNQNIYNNILKTDVKIHPRKLVRNLRNTKRIFEHFYPFIDPGNRIRNDFGNHGPEVQIINFLNEEELKSLIEQELGRLKSKNISPDKISILTNQEAEKSLLSKISQLGGYNLAYFQIEKYFSRMEKLNTKIKWSTVEDFKGMESHIIFLIQEKPMSYILTSKDISDKYVGYSRAKWLLLDFINCSDI